MPLFTVVADFAGGTYISQIRAQDAGEAVLKWARQLNVSAIPGLGEKSRAALLADLERDQREGSALSTLNGLASVWCVSQIVRGQLMLINIVQTELEAA